MVLDFGEPKSQFQNPGYERDGESSSPRTEHDHNCLRARFELRVEKSSQRERALLSKARTALFLRVGSLGEKMFGVPKKRKSFALALPAYTPYNV